MGLVAYDNTPSLQTDTIPVSGDSSSTPGSSLQINVADSYATIGDMFDDASANMDDANDLGAMLEGMQQQFQAKAALNILKSQIELVGNLINGIVDDLPKR